MKDFLVITALLMLAIPITVYSSVKLGTLAYYMIRRQFLKDDDFFKMEEDDLCD